ncbi:MAG: hypothetical protein GY835_24985 [bacterium]|nr:hypothetical protein [bacterium]
MEKKDQLKFALISAAAVIVAAAIGIIPSLTVDSSSSSTDEKPSSSSTASSAAMTFPVGLEIHFYPSGWMGDGGGEQGSEFLSVEPEVVEINGEKVAGIKILYRPGSKGWAGIYWQSPENNWGAYPGLDLTGAKRITFYARGQNGGEIAEFKSGGIREDQLTGRTHHDSFEQSLGRLVLQKLWRKYSIDLSNKDLSNVIGGFAWTSPAQGDPLTIHLAKIIIE